jgi:hypothetical protein
MAHRLVLRTFTIRPRWERAVLGDDRQLRPIIRSGGHYGAPFSAARQSMLLIGREANFVRRLSMLRPIDFRRMRSLALVAVCVAALFRDPSQSHDGWDLQARPSAPGDGGLA